MRMPLSRIERYASGKSPLVGIPVWDSTVDKLVTAVFHRSLLEAAVEFAKAKRASVEYVSKADNVKGTRTYELIFNGTKAGSWRLIDLKQGGKLTPWQIADMLRSWANGRRSAAVSRRKTVELGKDGVYVRRLREAVAKLEKQRGKMHVTRPSNPVLEKGRVREGSYCQEQEWGWHTEKGMRKALAKIQGDRIADTQYGILKTGRKRKPTGTWAEFYARVAAVTGQAVSESYRHDRICARKDGPDRIDYLKHLPMYIRASLQPYRHHWKMEDRIEMYRDARKDYLEQVREVKALDGQIEAHKAEIASALENREAHAVGFG